MNLPTLPLERNVGNMKTNPYHLEIWDCGRLETMQLIWPARLHTILTYGRRRDLRALAGDRTFFAATE
jgi:hypothetical protein